MKVTPYCFNKLAACLSVIPVVYISSTKITFLLGFFRNLKGLFVIIRSVRDFFDCFSLWDRSKTCSTFQVRLANKLAIGKAWLNPRSYKRSLLKGIGTKDAFLISICENFS